MISNKTIGVLFLALGIIMFVVGASLFSYKSDPFDPIIFSIGKYSFMLWLPTIIIGILIINLKRKKR